GQVLYAWNLFAGALSKEETALTNRMRATKPTILQDDVVEVVMDSPQALSFIQERHADIEQHLRRTLNNGNIKLQFRVREQTEAPRYLSRRELYQKMLQKSAALRSLKEALRLELS
ncbi:MAG: DNA polymerase III subunit gamma/tau, partial [Bacteroidaceae bacterium]|nr:DNA polymerase III subunit gamma/tau [Bacteroidaceae bacterium]